MLPDWHQFHFSDLATPAVVDSRRRLRICLGAFVVLLAAVFARAVQLEVTQGSAFRAEATRPLARERSLPGVRGRILARDGTVLAFDREILTLAVHYRYVQQPPDPRWLRRNARERLSRAERKDPERVAAEERRVQAERRELARRLAGLTGLTAEEWNARAGRIQARVERIAKNVAARRGRETPIAEELDYHVMVEDLPLAVVAEIEGHPERYPGVKILSRTRRAYPAGPLAAHVLGHLGPVQTSEIARESGSTGYHTEDFIGRTGLERQYESLLRGRRGVAVERTDHRGRIISWHRRREPGVGRDLVLTLDPRLQRAAESLLDSALKRRTIRGEDTQPAGGAVVVIDVSNGEILAAASAPRFDPNLFVGDRSSKLAALLADQSHPLFHRASKMAIPPGSLFKIVSAAALLENSAIDPQEKYCCHGYLHQSDRQRCAIYIQQGVGHGQITLAEALAQSCNVFFFHHAARLGPGPLADWAWRFGFGRLTGVDLPGEAAGRVPAPPPIGDLEGHAWRPGDTLSLAIGQGSLTATPMQVVRMIAAVANGGRLVTPHLVSRLGLPQLAEGQPLPKDDDDPIRIPPPQPIPGLGRNKTLAVIRTGLERVVSDPRGTAHATVHLDSVAIAGKTGTAETGEGRTAHAWFAGYVPAEQPKLALVVVLEHAGTAAVTAGPVAKRLVMRMQQLGLLEGSRAQ